MTAVLHEIYSECSFFQSWCMHRRSSVIRLSKLYLVAVDEITIFIVISFWQAMFTFCICCYLIFKRIRTYSIFFFQNLRFFLSLINIQYGRERAHDVESKNTREFFCLFFTEMLLFIYIWFGVQSTPWVRAFNYTLTS